MRVSCARSLRRAADAGNEQRVRPATGHPAPAPGPNIAPGTGSRVPEPGGPHGTVASSSARHGWLRRNAVSPVGVRLGGAPGAPLLMGARRQTGCLPANSDGTVLLPYPRSFRGWAVLLSDGGSTVSLPGGCDPGMRASGIAAWALSDSSPQLADTRQRTEERKALRQSWIYGGYQSTANQLWPPGPGYRVDGPSGFTQVAENHGRTISERHNRTPRRRACRA